MHLSILRSRRVVRRGVVAAVAGMLFALVLDPPAMAVDALAELPARLADTGLYADPASKTLAPGIFPFSPQYPLWSDGAVKRRWIRLPEGAAIDACRSRRLGLPGRHADLEGVLLRAPDRDALHGADRERRVALRDLSLERGGDRGAARTRPRRQAGRREPTGRALRPAQRGRLPRLPRERRRGRSRLLRAPALERSRPAGAARDAPRTGVARPRRARPPRPRRGAAGDDRGPCPARPRRDPHGPRRARLPARQLRPLPQRPESDRQSRSLSRRQGRRHVRRAHQRRRYARASTGPPVPRSTRGSSPATPGRVC